MRHTDAKTGFTVDLKFKFDTVRGVLRSNPLPVATASSSRLGQHIPWTRKEWGSSLDVRAWGP